MITSIIIAIIVIVAVYFGEKSLNGRIKENSIARMAGLGAVAFFASLIVNTTASVFLSWLMLGVSLAVIVLVIYDWAERGSEWAEMIPYAVVIISFFVIAKDAVRLICKLDKVVIGSTFFVSVLKIIPTMFLIFAIGYLITNYFYFRHDVVDEITEDDDEEDIEEKEENRPIHKMLGRIAMIATLIALIAMLIWCPKWKALASSKTTGNQPTVPTATVVEPVSATTKPATPVSEEELNAVQKNLTVRKVTIEELEKLTLNKYSKVSQVLLDSSLSVKDKERTESSGFSDALTFGFRDKTSKDEKFLELEEEILRNPVYALTVVNALVDKKIGDKTIGELNPWMEEMLKKDGGVAYWCERRDETATIYVTEEFRQYAATLCTWLERLVNQDVQVRQTTENWCLNAVATNNDRKGVKASYQYEKEALVLSWVTKDGATLLSVGFNIHDKRPEFFGGTPKNPDIVVDPPTPTPTPTPNPPTPNPPTPTPPPPEPEPVKDKTKGTQGELVAPNDNPGPGPDTNNGEGATESKKDQPTNSNHMTNEEYEEEIKELEETNKTQKTGDDPSTPTVTPEPGTKVDDNSSSKDNPVGPIDTPTPVQPPATESDGNPISDEPGEPWGGPSD